MPALLPPPLIIPWTAGPPPAGLTPRLFGLPHRCLLHSAAPAGPYSRWSLLMADPVAVLIGDAEGLFLRRGNQITRLEGSDPFHALAEFLESRRSPPDPRLPFVGGVAGYWGYDLRYHVERLPSLGQDDPPLPRLWLGLYDCCYAHDHLHNQGYLVAAHLPLADGGPAPDRRLRELRQALTQPVDPKLLRQQTEFTAGEVVSNFTREEYLNACRRILDYIAAGDCYQVNLSQRFSAPYEGSPWALYRRLRQASPAPYAAFLETDEATICSISPERFLRITGREIESRPIKGTRPRGASPEEDARLAAELLSSEKDRAELVMIVDLVRNDLGRVCEYGSVHVPEPWRLESHPQVHHLVATVRGRLRKDAGPVDALRASFPGGSITGAPKVRAMEIIEELEPHHRGVYTGNIGYISLDGQADWNIAIRTAVVTGGRAYYQAGGGIVADSQPEAEYEETLDKARAFLQALAD